MNIIRLSVFLLLLSGVYNLSAREIHPEHFYKKVTIYVNKKERTYYRLHPSNPLEIKVDGPKLLKIYVRSRASNDKYREKYRILYTIDESPIRYRVNMSGYPNRNVNLKGNKGQIISSSGLLSIQVTEGKHLYRFYGSTKNKNRVYARPIVSSISQKKITTSSDCKPVRENVPVKLKYEDKKFTYYRIVRDSSVVIELEGPGDLVIYNRLEFKHWMEEPCGYRIQIKEDKKVLGTYQITTKKSLYTDYEIPLNMVVGQIRSIVLHVPEGMHRYTFSLLDRRKSVLMKFRKS